MNGKRAKKLRKLAREHHKRACGYFKKNIPGLTWARWVKKAYTAGTLKVSKMSQS